MRPVHELSSLGSSVRENPCHDSENEQIRILLERQREQILADCRAEIQKHEFQADYDRRSIQKLNGVIESQRGEINRALAGNEQLQRDEQLLHEQFNYWNKNRELREAHVKSLNEMVELHDSRDFKDAESVRSGQSHVTSQPAFFPTFQKPGGKSKPFCGHAEPQLWAAKYLGHGMENRETFFAYPTASSSATFPQSINSWNTNMSERTSPHVMSESQTPVQDQRCQSGPSARNSFVPSEGRFSKNYRADQQRLQISDLHFDKFPNPATLACWKIRFKTEVCTCSQFLTEAMLWIKEVEMVESVHDLESSCSIRGIRTPDFEVLDAKIASALNRIIHNTRFKRKVSLEEQKAQKQDRFHRGRQIAYLIYEYFRVTGANDSVDNYADLFTNVLRNDDFQEFDSKWDGILSSMTKIPFDDILVGLYKLRIRESEKLKTVLEFYNVAIHQKKAGPDYHRLKTMVKKVSSRIYKSRILRPETEIMRRTPWSRIRLQNSVDKEFLEIVGSGKPMCSVLKETIAVSGTI